MTTSANPDDATRIVWVLSMFIFFVIVFLWLTICFILNYTIFWRQWQCTMTTRGSDVEHRPRQCKLHRLGLKYVLFFAIVFLLLTICFIAFFFWRQGATTTTTSAGPDDASCNVEPKVYLFYIHCPFNAAKFNSDTHPLSFVSSIHLDPTSLSPTLVFLNLNLTQFVRNLQDNARILVVFAREGTCNVL